MPGQRMLTLTLSDQATRRPLLPWSAELCDSFRVPQGETTTMEHGRAVIGHGNAAALVQAHAGRLDDAERICDAQIAWVQTLADGSGERGLLTLALQPWINIGRLRGITGRTDDALRYYQDVRDCRMDASSLLAGRVIRSEDWVAAGWNVDTLERFGRAVLASDSIRVLLAAGRADDVLALADEDTDGAERVSAVLREARLVALARLGDVDQALAHADRYRREASSWDRIILQLRWAEIVRLSGQEDRARQALDELVAVCGRLPVAESLQLLVLFAVQHLVTLRFQMEPSRECFELAERLLAGARRNDDEVMQFEVLRLLAVHGRAGAERDRYRDELRQLSETTAYARLRPRECPHESAAALDRLMAVACEAMRAA